MPRNDNFDQILVLKAHLGFGSVFTIWYLVTHTFKPELGRVRYKKILGSGSGSGTRWALIATLPYFRLVNCLRRKGCPYDRASSLFIFITIIITIIIIMIH